MGGQMVKVMCRICKTLRRSATRNECVIWNPHLRETLSFNRKSHESKANKFTFGVSWKGEINL